MDREKGSKSKGMPGKGKGGAGHGSTGHGGKGRKSTKGKAAGRKGPKAAAPPGRSPGSGLASGGKPRATASPPGERQRRSFSQKTLALEAEGPLGDPLAEALMAAGSSGYSLTHAFHPYPGRFHPFLVSKVLAAVAQPGQLVFDPFMGGGTTLVEAMRIGLPTLGNDLNPVAHLVARERTRTRTADEARILEAEFGRIAAQVEGLAKEKNPPRYEKPDQHRITPHYQPHLLAELMQWIRIIDAMGEESLRETLRAVFSSAVVKFSNLASDSRGTTGTPPRYPKGAVSRFLVMKGHQLARTQATLAAHVPPGTPQPQWLQEDARLLPSLAWGVCDMVVTSPPYPGIYDYYEHHSLRMNWLEMDSSGLFRDELVPRRDRSGSDEEAPESWSAGFKDVLGTLARVLRPQGKLFLVLGDWISGGHAVNAGGLLTRIAREAGWIPVSRAAARRESHSPAERKAFARKGKWEHLLHFERESAEKAAPEKEQAEPVKTGRVPRKRRERMKVSEPPPTQKEPLPSLPATPRRVVPRRKR